MKLASIQQVHWYGELSLETAEAVFNEIVRRFEVFPVVLVIDNPSCTDLEIYPSQQLDQFYLSEGNVFITLNFYFPDRRFQFSTDEGWKIDLQGGSLRLTREDSEGQIVRIYWKEQA